MKKQSIYPYFNPREHHPFHIVDRSLLPIWTSQSVFMLILAILYYFHPNFLTTMPNAWVFYAGSFFFFALSLISWFIQVIIESGNGYHSTEVRQGLKLGMILFIVSEVMFFFAFFWAFFHASLSPSVIMGSVWPPSGIQPLEIWGLPLVNTLLLLSSGVTITLAHHAIIESKDYQESNKFDGYLAATILFGVAFLFCQAIEYKYGLTFTWKENIYGSTFFVATGFHGLHVVIGTLFLLFCLIRSLMTNKISRFNFAPTLKYIIEAKKRLQVKVIEPTLGARKWGPIWGPVLYTPINLLIITTMFLQWILQWPKTLYPTDRLMAWMKRETKNYRTEKTWKALLLAIFAHTHLYMVLGINVMSSQFNKFYWWAQRDLTLYRFTQEQHLGFEAAAWYWHFVDVVWLFLFISIYWWGS